MNLRAIFDVLDSDHSGGISVEEITSALPLLGMTLTHDQVVKMFREADTDGSGHIDFGEFCHVVENGRPGAGGAFARVVQKMADDARLRGGIQELVEQGAQRGSNVVLADKHLEQLQQQLARTREERLWMSGLHMHSVQSQVNAARAGYTHEDSIAPTKSEPISVTVSPWAANASPPVHRTAKPMLPELQEQVQRPFKLQQLYGQGPGLGLREQHVGRSVSHTPRRPPGMKPEDVRSTSQSPRRPPRTRPQQPKEPWKESPRIVPH